MDPFLQKTFNNPAKFPSVNGQINFFKGVIPPKFGNFLTHLGKPPINGLLP